MFNLNDIIRLIEFTNDNEIQFYIEGIYLCFVKEEYGMYHHYYMPIEIFESQTMKDNIEQLKTKFDIKEERNE